jgi:ABC-type antimicrobial peptide transport system permease subunit
VRNAGLQQEPLPQIYTPYTVIAWDSITLSVRTRESVPVSKAALRQAVASVNRTQAINRISSLDERLRDAGWGRQQFAASMFLACALFALIVAAVGLHSIVAHTVSQRSQEFALRNALGATRTQVTLLVFETVGGAVAAGLGIGIILTAALDRPIAAWTSGTLWHLATLVPAVALFAAIGAGAIFMPTRRAMSADPMTLLRNDRT